MRFSVHRFSMKDKKQRQLVNDATAAFSGVFSNLIIAVPGPTEKKTAVHRVFPLTQIQTFQLRSTAGDARSVLSATQDVCLKSTSSIF